MLKQLIGILGFVYIRFFLKLMPGILLLLIGGLSFANQPGNITSASTPDNNSQYIVKANDTLYSIAWQFGLDYRDIAALNNLKVPYDLHIGQPLILVEGQHTAPPGLGNPPIIVKHLPGYSGQTSSVTVKTPATAQLPAKNVVNGWIWPTRGSVIKNYSTLSDSMNKGIDITGKLGQSVVASATGMVVYSGNGVPGYGNLIILKHNANYLTAYAYNKKNLVKEGQTVEGGEEIALMGTGEMMKPELHFEIRYDGKPVNPVNYLPKR